VIYLTPDINSGASSPAIRRRFTESSETVEVTTLDDIIGSRELGRAGIVKIAWKALKSRCFGEPTDRSPGGS
jgi:hypothetical protein